MDGGRWTGWGGLGWKLRRGSRGGIPPGYLRYYCDVAEGRDPTFKRPPTPRRMCHGNHSGGGGFSKGRVEKGYGEEVDAGYGGGLLPTEVEGRAHFQI